MCNHNNIYLIYMVFFLQIISAEEMMKRKSIDTDDIILMPELLAKSNILEDFHLEMVGLKMYALTS